MLGRGLAKNFLVRWGFYAPYMLSGIHTFDFDLRLLILICEYIKSEVLLSQPDLQTSPPNSSLSFSTLFFATTEKKERRVIFLMTSRVKQLVAAIESRSN